MTDLDWRPLLTDPIYVPGSRRGGSRLALVQAILQTVAYADVFDYPLTQAEIYHYLVGVSASLEAVQDALLTDPLLSTYLLQVDGYYVLPGREHLIPLRQGRSLQARRLVAEGAHLWSLAQPPAFRAHGGSYRHAIRR